MKRFLVFSGMTYYPQGGMKDFQKDFDTYIEALEFLVENSNDWWQIYDLQENKIMREKHRKDE